jgi:hypothetical protein
MGSKLKPKSLVDSDPTTPHKPRDTKRQTDTERGRAAPETTFDLNKGQP